MSDELILSHVAQVRMIVPGSRDALLATVRDKGYLGESEVEPYLFRAEISSDVLDSHYTHMAESTLNNYARDAEKGVAFLKGHDYRQLPIGYSLTGTVESGDKKRVVADFYTVPGIAETDDLIFRMKTGLLRDVSVGFHGGRMVCDICSQDFWECRHWPGIKYEEKVGDTVTTKLATYTIEDARLSEVSGVFDGSTPDAMILKAQRAAKAGNLSREQVTLLEQKYRISLPATRYFVPPQESKMNESQVTRLKEIVINTGLVPEAERTTLDEETTLVYVDKLAAQNQTLQAQAADGVEYRNSLVTEALAEGVRAQGDKFNRALYEPTLRSASLAVIRQMRDDWKTTADALLPGNRRSNDTGDAQKKAVRKAHPTSAFKS